MAYSFVYCNFLKGIPTITRNGLVLTFRAPLCITEFIGCSPAWCEILSELKWQFIVQGWSYFNTLTLSWHAKWAISWDYGTFLPPYTHSSNTHALTSSGARCLFLVGPFVYFHISRVGTEKALVRLRWCAGSPEPSLVAYVISTIISWAGSNLTRMKTN